MGDDPPYLQVGTEVSAKYKGAFCEAKIRKVVRVVKCKVTFKAGLGSANLSDDHIKGDLRVGSVVEAKHQDKNLYAEATINKIQDCSQYTVVFDDGDITTLRRSALCLKSGRHFNESETLDQLPLTHPEHFSNPVVGGRRGVRRRAANNDDNENESSEDEDAAPMKKGHKKPSKEADMGKVVCVESTDKKKSKDNWFPALIVSPSAQETVKIRTKDEYLVRSFRDGRYYTVPKKEITDFTKDSKEKSEHSSSFLRGACEKAVQYLEKNVLPPHWDRDILFGHSNTSNSDEVLSDSESEDDPREDKDRFVAQLFKFMDERGTPINKVPSFSGKDLDLYKLYKIVTSKGGYNKVTNSSQWKPVTMKMGYGAMPTTSTINLVKQAYKKFLHNFEEFYRKLGCPLTSLNSRPPVTPAGKSRSNRSIFRERERHASSSLGKKEKEDSKKDAKDDEIDKKSTTSAASGTASATPSEVDAETESLIEGESATEEPRRSRSRLESRGKKEFDEVSDKADKPGVSKSKRVSKKKESSASANTSTVSASELKEREKEREEAQTPVSASPSPAPSSSGGKRGRGKYKKRDKQQEADEDENRSEPEESHDHIGKNVRIDLGDKLQVYYGPKSKGNVTYEAKVIDIDAAGVKFLVHYTGWNTRYDEWIDRYRIASTSNQKDGGGPPDMDSISTSSPSGSTTKTTPKAPKKKGRPASVGTGGGSGSGGPPQSSSTSAAKGKVATRKRLLSESEKTKGRRSRKKSGPESVTHSGSESDQDQDQDAGDSSDSEEKQRLISTPPSSVSSTASSARASNKAGGGRGRKIPLTMAAEDDDASSASSSTTVSSTEKSCKPDSGPPVGNSSSSSNSNNRENTLTPAVSPSAFVGSNTPTNETNQNQVIDLNKIRSEMKGLDKMVKVSTSATTSPSVATTSHQSTSSASNPGIVVSSAQSSPPVSVPVPSTSVTSSTPLPQSTTVVAVAAASTAVTTVPAVTLHSHSPQAQASHSVGADIKLDVYEFQDDANDAPRLKMFAPRSPDKKEESCMKTGIVANVDVEKSTVKSGEETLRHHPCGTVASPSVAPCISSNVSLIIPNPSLHASSTVSSASVKSSLPTAIGKDELVSVKPNKEIKKDTLHAKEKGRKEKEVKESPKVQTSPHGDSSIPVVSKETKGGKHSSAIKASPTVLSTPTPVSTFDRLSHPHSVKASTPVGGSKSPASGVSGLQPTMIIENKSSLKMQNPVLHTPQQAPRQRAVISSYPPPLIPSGTPKPLPVQVPPRVGTLSPPMPSLTLRPVIPSLVANASPNSSNVVPGLPTVTPQLHPQIQHLRPVAPTASAILNIPSVTPSSTESPIQANLSASNTVLVPLPPTPSLYPASTIVSTSSTVTTSHKVVDSKTPTTFANRQHELFPHLVQQQQHQQQQQQQPPSLLKTTSAPLPKIAPLTNPAHATHSNPTPISISVITPNQSMTSSGVGNMTNASKDSIVKNPTFSQSQSTAGLSIPSLGVISTATSSPFTSNLSVSPKKSPVKRKQPSKEKNRAINTGIISSGLPAAAALGTAPLGANLPPKKKPRKVITKNIIDIHKNEGESILGHAQGQGSILMQGSSSITVPSLGRPKDGHGHTSGGESPTKKARKPAKKRIKIDSDIMLGRGTSGSGVGMGDKLTSPVKTPKKKQLNKMDISAPPQLVPAKGMAKNQSNLRYVPPASTNSSSNVVYGGPNTLGPSVSFANSAATANIMSTVDKPGSSPGTLAPTVLQDPVIKPPVYIKPPELQSAQAKPMNMKGITSTMGNISGSVLGVLKTPDKKSYSSKMSAAAAARIASCIDTVAKLPPEAQTKSVLTIQPAKASPSQSPTSNPASVAVPGTSTMTTTFVKIPGKFEPEPIVITTVTTAPPAPQPVATKPITVIPAMVQKAVSGASTVQTINIPSSNSKNSEAAKPSTVLTALPSSLILSSSGSDIGGRNIKPIMVVPISKDSISIPQATLPVILKTEMKEEKPKPKLGLDVQVAPTAVPILFVKKNPIISVEPNTPGQASHINISNSSSSSSSSTSTSVLSIKVSGGGAEEGKIKVLEDTIPVVSIKEAPDPVPMKIVDIVKNETGTSCGTKDEDESCHSLLCEEEIPGSPPPGTDSSLFGIDDENARISLSSPKESPKLLPATAIISNNPTSSTSVLNKMQTPYNSGSSSASSSSNTSSSAVSTGVNPIEKGAENIEKKTDEIFAGVRTSNKPSASCSSAAQSSNETLNLLQKHRDVGKAAQSLLSLADRPSASVSGHSGHGHNQNQSPIVQPPIGFPNPHNQNQAPVNQPPMAFPNPHNQNLQHVMDNTPPTTPESSSISSGSPRVEGGRVSPTQDHPSSSKSNSKDSSDGDSTDQKINEITEEGSSSDAGRKSLKGGSSSVQKKRHVETNRNSRNSSPPTKRRRVQRRKSPDEVIRSYGYRGRGSGARKSNSDKDHDHGKILPPPPPINLTRPPMSRKFNLIPDLDDAMESEHRIQVLQLALQSIKEKYQEVKSELSSEERRLKRYKRRQKEREKEKSRACLKNT